MDSFYVRMLVLKWRHHMMMWQNNMREFIRIKVDVLPWLHYLFERTANYNYLYRLAISTRGGSVPLVNVSPSTIIRIHSLCTYEQLPWFVICRLKLAFIPPSIHPPLQKANDGERTQVTTLIVGSSAGCDCLFCSLQNRRRTYYIITTNVAAALFRVSCRYRIP